MRTAAYVSLCLFCAFCIGAMFVLAADAFAHNIFAGTMALLLTLMVAWIVREALRR